MRIPIASLLLMFAPLQAVVAGDLQVEQVTNNTYVALAKTGKAATPAQRAWHANSGFVVGREGVLVIDTGGSEAQGQALRRAIAEVTDLPVRWIVITHAHVDHALGTAALRGPKTEIFSTVIAQQEIEESGVAWVARVNRETGASQAATSVVVPQRIVDSWTEINLGEMTVVLWPMRPAHSSGDLVVWLPKQKILFAGDTVTAGSMPKFHDAHLQSWLGALQDLESLGAARVVPGHGTAASGAAVQRMHDLLDDLWKLVQDGQKGGQNYVDITTRAKAMIANRHARHFPDYEQGLTENVQAVLKQLSPASQP